jgi:membrane-bound ClpP family serine protease
MANIFVTLLRNNSLMKNKVSKYLSQPAPVNDKPWLSVLLCVVIVIFILAIFEPFNFKLNSLGQIWVLIGFALVTMLVTSIAFVLLPVIFKRFYNTEKWTIGRSLLNNVFILIIMGIGVVCYDYFIVMKQLPEYFPMGFLVDLFAALTIGIVPISIITIITQNRALKRNLNISKDINQVLSARIKPEVTENGLITLTGSTKESIIVKPEDILYIEATGNYVNVHYKKDSKTIYKLLRTTIKQVEEALQNQPSFVRCHRTYIVNTDKISNVNGNAQGYKLSLYDTTEEIPVSRTYLKDIKDILR